VTSAKGTEGESCLPRTDRLPVPVAKAPRSVRRSALVGEVFLRSADLASPTWVKEKWRTPSGVAAYGGVGSSSRKRERSRARRAWCRSRGEHRCRSYRRGRPRPEFARRVRQSPFDPRLRHVSLDAGDLVPQGLDSLACTLIPREREQDRAMLRYLRFIGSLHPRDRRPCQ
jgi:hypothetical protein